MGKLMQHRDNCNRAIWGSILILLSICAVFFFKGGVPVYAEETDGISAKYYIQPKDEDKREYTGESAQDGEYVTGDNLTLSVEVTGLSTGQRVEYTWQENSKELTEKSNTLKISKKYDLDSPWIDYYCEYVVYDNDNEWVTSGSNLFSIYTKYTIKDFTPYISYNGKKYDAWYSEVNELDLKKEIL